MAQPPIYLEARVRAQAADSRVSCAFLPENAPGFGRGCNPLEIDLLAVQARPI